MKNFFLLMCSLLLVAGMLGNASATTYTSTFDVAGDFALTGFSDTTNNPPTATIGPDTLTINNPSGIYNLDVPPAGIYDWYVDFNSLTFDFYGDSPPELSFTDKGPYFIGSYATPTPGLTGTYNFGDVDIPAYTNSGVTVGGYQVNNLSLDWTITMSGTNITQIVFDISAGNLSTTLNKDFTFLDNDPGGANGIIDGHVTADFSVSAVPEPATLFLLGFGLLGMAGCSRKNFFKKG